MLPGLEVRIGGDPSAALAAVRQTDAALDGLAEAQRTAGAAAQAMGAQTERLNSILAAAAAMHRRAAGAVSPLSDAMKGVKDSTEGVIPPLVKAGDGAETTGQQFRTAEGNLGNFAAQWNDIGVMIASGQSPIQLALQQGTQVNQAFAAMGEAGNTLRGRMSMLAASFASVISPASLVTIGVIAGGAALAQWGMEAWSASSNALTLEESLESLQAIMSALQAAQDIMAMSVQELADTYGRYSEQVLAAAQALGALQAAEARAAIGDIIGDLDSLIARYTQVELGWDNAFVNVGANRLAEELGISEELAGQLSWRLEELGNATTFDDQASALQRIGQLLRENNVDLAQIPPELRRALIEANQLVVTMGELATEADRAAAAVAGMTFGGGLQFDDIADVMPPMPGTNAPPARPGRRGGGGGAPRENPLIRELEALRNHLMTAAEIEIQAYEQRQETLRNALEQRLITQAEYNARMEELQRQHNATMAQLDVYRYGSGLQQAEQFFGDMADALASGNEKMQRAAKAFAAAEALINAWRAYSQVMADPSLPWFAKIPAALKVLAAGMQAVNAIKGGGSRGRPGAGGGGGNMASASAGGGNGLNINVDIAGDYIRPGQISSALMTDQILRELERRGVSMNVRVRGAMA